MSQKIYDRLINSHRGLQSGVIRDVLLPAILGDETDRSGRASCRERV